MVKVLDLDKLFDKYISGYVYKNIGKVKPEEIENQMPVLYDKFGDEKLDVLDGKTPNTYYKSFTAEELLDCLKEHLDKGVSVSDFLCEALTGSKANEKAMLNELKNDNTEEYTLYLMNMLSDLGSTACCDRYMEFILWDYSESVRELATELLCPMADLVKEKILENFKEVDDVRKSCLTQILSYCGKDDRVFDILIAEFVKNQDEVPLYAGYLGKYGDERALPFLLTAIENTKINYADFEEIRFAIESLGGTYDKERDFSADKIYKKIKGEQKEKSDNKE